MSGETGIWATETPPVGTELATCPDVRLLPDGRVAWLVPPGLPGGTWEWLSTASGTKLTAARWYWESELPLADAQRMVPAGPLLELVERFSARARYHKAARIGRPYDLPAAMDEGSEIAFDEIAFDLAANELHCLLATLSACAASERMAAHRETGVR